MTNYEKKILNDLLDRFERSKSFIGSNKVNQRFSVKLAKLFPTYDDEATYEPYIAIMDAMEKLESKQYVTVTLQKNGIPDSVALNTQMLQQIYAALGRIPKADVNETLRRILLQYRSQNEVLQTYCNKQLERLAHNKKVEFFDAEREMSEYENILKAVSQIFDVDEETYIRDFSVRVLGDSKAFSRIQNKVVRLLFRYGDFPLEETLLEDLNIVRNPGHVYLKGSGQITISGQTIDLSVLSGDIAFSSDLLKQITRISVTGSRVLTIENLTSFHAFSEPDTLAIYLGGYHNAHRRNFIQKIHQQNPDAKYYHYGDIDAGGFYILLHLRNKTGVGFHPYHMDIETLQQYHQYTKTLTENDRSRLEKLLDSEFRETVSYMLEYDCKLEQEALD